MTPPPVVSVVMPCYNNAKFIGEAIQSVLNQSHPVGQIIVVDDGSTDNSASVVQQFSGVRLIQQPNGGPSKARNAGIEAAHGEWIAFLDADDYWHPMKLERQFDALSSNPDVICCYTATTIVYGAEQFPFDPPPTDHSIVSLLRHWIIPPSAALVRSSVPVRFPEWARAGEDLIYFAELSLHGRFLGVQDRLTYYRKYNSSSSDKPEFIARNRECCFDWIDRISDRIPAELVETAKRELTEDLFDRLDAFRWKRQWERFHVLRTSMRASRHIDHGDRRLSRLILPAWIYALRDRFFS